MLKARIIIFLIVLVAFNSCRKKDIAPNPLPTSNQLLPLKIGNNWLYSNTEFNEDGTVKLTGSNKLVVTDTVVKKNHTYFVIKDAALLNNTLLLLRSEEKAVFAYSEDNHTEFTYYKCPVTDREILYSITSGLSKEEGIASTATLVTNNLGGYTITRNVYVNNQLNKYSELYFRPTIGIIGTVNYSLKSGSTGFYKSYENRLASFVRK